MRGAAAIRAQHLAPTPGYHRLQPAPARPGRWRTTKGQILHPQHDPAPRPSVGWRCWGSGLSPVPPSLVPSGAGGARGERCPALTAALPACDTFLAARVGSNVPTAPSAARRPGWAKPRAHPCAGHPCGSLPGTPRAPRGSALSLPAPGAGHRREFCPVSCRDAGGGTQGRVTLPTAECHQAQGSVREGEVRGRPRGEPLPALAACNGEEMRWDQARWSPKDPCGGLHGADSGAGGAPGLCTGLSSGVCCSSELSTVRGCRAQSCCEVQSHQQLHIEVAAEDGGEQTRSPKPELPGETGSLNDALGG